MGEKAGKKHSPYGNANLGTELNQIRFQEKDIDDLVGTIGRRQESLLPLLQAIQDRYRYLPDEALRRLCQITEITPSQVEGVVGFYERFRREPAGRHSIRVCIGTACHVKGADAVFSAFQRHLGLAGDRDTDRNGMFTLEKAACLGCCMLAPAVQIDNTIYGFMTAQRVPPVLQDFLESVAAPEKGVEEQPKRGAEKGEVRICLCSSCQAGGSGKVYRAFQEEIQSGLYRVRLRSVGCSGISFEAPLVEVVVGGGGLFRYGRAADAEVPQILDRHFRSAKIQYRTGILLSRIMDRLEAVISSAFIGPPVQERDEADDGSVIRYSESVRETGVSAFLHRQKHLVLEHAGELDPLDFDHYQAKGGYEGLRKCLTQLSPEEVVRVVAESGLRGRGGGGFPVARKWETVLLAGEKERYVVCNGDEGDPGAFMDRMMLESFPFRVIEGLLIAAYAVKAAECYVYIRGEYPLALERMKKALSICRAEGRLPPAAGNVGLHIVQGAGAFVCGEETALIAALEGKRGMPRVRPPYPSERGFRGKPTLVNNVETFAVVPWILREGSDAFRRYGTPDSRGTKAFALAGKIRHGGLIEIPMGTTLNTIVNDIGGGLEGGRTFKAVQIGGPSGGCIPAVLGDTPVDYEAFQALGAMMGSGGLVVLDDTDCMVDLARYFVSFTQKESCGKCTFCRVGTKRLVEILERLCSGKAKSDDLVRLEELSRLIQRGSLCGLGKTSVNPVLTTLRYFPEEYEAHMRGKCPAGKCKALVRYQVGEECIGCTRCAQNCPVGAIQANPHERQEIDPQKCIRCDTCRQICPVHAVRIV